MRIVRTRTIVGIVLVLVAISLLTSCAAASTTGWWFVHGAAAEVENMAGIVNVVRSPPGYTIVLAPGATNFVEIAIPSHFASNVSVNRIFAQFSTDSPLMQVGVIEVWNGAVLIAPVTNATPWSGATIVNAPLPRKIKFSRGLMLRFMFQNTDPANSHQFLLTTAGARFAPFP
jgi:hypothetical protein